MEIVFRESVEVPIGDSEFEYFTYMIELFMAQRARIVATILPGCDGAAEGTRQPQVLHF
jgi:hypothetical protein